MRLGPHPQALARRFAPRAAAGAADTRRRQSHPAARPSVGDCAGSISDSTAPSYDCLDSAGSVSSLSPFSISAAVRARSARPAATRASAARSPRMTRLASGIAVGAMLNSRSPRPTSSVSTTGSAAISPHTATGILAWRPARTTSRIARMIAGCSGS